MIVHDADAEVGFGADRELETALPGEIVDARNRMLRAKRGGADQVGTGSVQAINQLVSVFEDLIREVVAVDVEQLETRHALFALQNEGTAKGTILVTLEWIEPDVGAAVAA